MKSTLNINELIAVLQGVSNLHGPNVPVFATWEGVLAPIKADCISVDKGIILIDVEDY